MLVLRKRVPRAARASISRSTCAKEPRVVRHQSLGYTDMSLDSMERSDIGNPNSRAGPGEVDPISDASYQSGRSLYHDGPCV